MIVFTTFLFLAVASRILQILLILFQNLLLLFPGTKAAELQLEKQPHPGVCTPMACPGGDSPTLHQIPPLQDFSPNSKHVGLEKPQCWAWGGSTLAYLTSGPRKHWELGLMLPRPHSYEVLPGTKWSIHERCTYLIELGSSWTGFLADSFIKKMDGSDEYQRNTQLIIRWSWLLPFWFRELHCLLWCSTEFHGGPGS